MRIKRITVNVGRILLVIVFLVGLILLSTDFIKTRIRQNVADEAIKAAESVIDDGGGVITIKLPVTDYLEVHGENGESDTTIKDFSYIPYVRSHSRNCLFKPQPRKPQDKCGEARIGD